MRLTAILTACLFPLSLWAQDFDGEIDAALETHILPGMDRVAEASAALESAAQTQCHPESEDLRSAYHAAFGAWVHIGHLRFGPTETDNRAFALAFWPDGRGATPRSLTQLIASEDPVVQSTESFADVSVAARGFYALEFLLFDADLSTHGAPGYHCALVQIVTADIADLADAIREDWRNTHADLLRAPDPAQLYQSDADAMRALFNALTTGLEFNADVRLGRPLGNVDRPRPNRAEARRSGRSLANLVGSVVGLEELAAALAVADPELAATLTVGFTKVREAAAHIQDESFADIADPQARLRLEVVQQRLRELHGFILQSMGPRLGIAAGFNALDGD